MKISPPQPQERGCRTDAEHARVSGNMPGRRQSIQYFISFDEAIELDSTRPPISTTKNVTPLSGRHDAMLRTRAVLFEIVVFNHGCALASVKAFTGYIAG